MKIALEAKRFFESGTGFGNYSRTLVGDLATFFPDSKYLLYAPDTEQSLSISSMAHSAEIDRTLSHRSVKVIYPPLSLSGKLYWKTFGARKSLRDNQIDLYHGLSQQIPRSIRLSKVPKILSIHDLIYRKYPDLCPEEDLKALDKQIKRACQISDHIVAVSENTKRDLIQSFGINPSKISVIYQACDPRYAYQNSADKRQRIKEKYNLPDSYLLYVGSITKRKNLLTIVKALNVLPKEERLPLVVVGGRTSYTQEVLRYAEENDLRELLIFPRYVATDDLPAVYQSARLFLYTSLYEGFGIPVVEAIASGIPVISSSTSSLPEAAGSRSFLVEPLDVDQTAEAIMRLNRDDALREEMIEEGHRHCQKFDNRRVTVKLSKLYARLATKKESEAR